MGWGEVGGGWVRGGAEGGKKKYPRKFLWIPLRLSLTPDTPPFFFLGKIFLDLGGGRLTNPLSLSLSLSLQAGLGEI